MNSLKKYKPIIIAAFAVLSEHPHALYSQKEITAKLNQLGMKISTSQFNKAIKGRHVGTKSIIKIAEGLQEIIALELNLKYNGESQNFEKNVETSWKKIVVGTKVIEEANENGLTKKGRLNLQEGRMIISEKVEFMSSAQKEIILFGVRLRQFCSYFSTRSDAEFKSRIANILERGVDINCYLLDPQSNACRFYLEDRAKVIKKERHGDRVITEVIKELNKISNEFQDEGYSGKLNLFKYRHIPHDFFMAVDGNYPHGKIAGSHYLFGVPRSKSPVFLFEKRADPEMFSLYWKSLQHLCKGAILVD